MVFALELGPKTIERNLGVHRLLFVEKATLNSADTLYVVASFDEILSKRPIRQNEAVLLTLTTVVSHVAFLTEAVVLSTSPPIHASDVTVLDCGQNNTII